MLLESSPGNGMLGNCVGKQDDNTYAATDSGAESLLMADTAVTGMIASRGTQ